MRLVLGGAAHRRTLFRWINLQFNAVDHERVKAVGPDRVCAEWILKNGGAIRWTTSPTVISDYNELPQEGTVLRLKAVDATGSSIMHNGFEHFKGCNYVTDVILNECYYLEDDALSELRYLKNSLTFLQVSSCPNLTDKGLLHLGVLHKLNRLDMFNLAAVKDLGKVAQALKSSLPKCNIQTKSN